MASKTSPPKKSRTASNRTSSTLSKLLIVVVAAIAVYFFNQYFNPAAVAEGTADFHFIDVGQGDSALIMTDAGNILIDAGPASASELLNAYLDKCGVTQLEYIIFTHPHEDHIGSAAAVVRSRTVKNVIMPDMEYDTKTYERLLDALEEHPETNVIPAVSGAVYTLGDLSFQLLAPNSASYSSTNDYSVVAKFTFGAISFLFTGDAEVYSENEILDKYGAYALRSTVLKVGHHGSSTSTGQAFLNAVSPKVAVISCAQGNDYGHPHAETLDKLNVLSITLHRTDLEGTIVLTTDGSTLKVK